MQEEKIVLCERKCLWVRLGKKSNKQSEILEYWMVWTKDTVLAMIRTQMVTEALDMYECAEWDEKVAQERSLEEH